MKRFGKKLHIQNDFFTCKLGNLGLQALNRHNRVYHQKTVKYGGLIPFIVLV
jgi:hypothetical protein